MPLEFPLTTREVDAIAVAYDELLSYWETVGYEGSLDDEELPSQQIPWTLETLRGLLDRHAKFEHLTAAAARHGGVLAVPPVRFEYHPDTPPSGPTPTHPEGETQTETLALRLHAMTYTLERVVGERDRLRETLAALVAWHPVTDRKLAELHPQHREALEIARRCLKRPEGDS